ncbi:MAG: SIS domain-containing protein [Micrococcales bacterium]|nr:SIS domain-containing protein [Micrococcales bacterium]
MVGQQMLTEIEDQPRALRATLARLEGVEAEVSRLAAGRRHVLFVARGSSDNAALYARYLVESRAGIQAAMAAPSVATHYGARVDLSDTLVVSISQSGRTEEIVATQQWARECGAATAAVTNAAGSPLADDADLALVTEAGPELAVPATKSYTTQLAALAVLASGLMADPTGLQRDLARVPDEVERLVGALRDSGELAAAVLMLAGARDHTIVSGRGLLLGTAMEVALKLEETCLSPVRSSSYADLRHGPISVVDSDMLAVLVAAQDGPLDDAMVGLALDLRRRGARVLGIGGTAAFAQACERTLPGPDLPEQVAPIAAIVPAQIAIHGLALGLGLDPDAPRGLAKVTQTDPHSDDATAGSRDSKENP